MTLAALVQLREKSYNETTNKIVQRALTDEIYNNRQTLSGFNPSTSLPRLVFSMLKASSLEGPKEEGQPSLREQTRKLFSMVDSEICYRKFETLKYRDIVSLLHLFAVGKGKSFPSRSFISGLLSRFNQEFMEFENEDDMANALGALYSLGPHHFQDEGMDNAVEDFLLTSTFGEGERMIESEENRKILALCKRLHELLHPDMELGDVLQSLPPSSSTEISEQAKLEDELKQLLESRLDMARI